AALGDVRVFDGPPLGDAGQGRVLDGVRQVPARAQSDAGADDQGVPGEAGGGKEVGSVRPPDAAPQRPEEGPRRRGRRTLARFVILPLRYGGGWKWRVHIAGPAGPGYRRREPERSLLPATVRGDVSPHFDIGHASRFASPEI